MRVWNISVYNCIILRRDADLCFRQFSSALLSRSHSIFSQVTGILSKLKVFAYTRTRKEQLGATEFGAARKKERWRQTRLYTDKKVPRYLWLYCNHVLKELCSQQDDFCSETLLYTIDSDNLIRCVATFSLESQGNIIGAVINCNLRRLFFSARSCKIPTRSVSAANCSQLSWVLMRTTNMLGRDNREMSFLIDEFSFGP